MEMFYLVVFGVSAAAAAALQWSKAAEKSEGNANKEFLRFRNNYVLVYGLMMGESH